jgi:hypothetical protein
MTKRAKYEFGLVNLFEIHGMFEHLYSFMMYPMLPSKKQNEENIKNFLHIRSINKACHSHANRLEKYVCPYIKSSNDLPKWVEIMPQLRYMCVTKNHISIPELLKNIRGIQFLRNSNACIFNKPLNSIHLESWNWLLLEHLEISNMVVTELQIQTMSIKFPNLKKLHVRAKSQELFTVSHFPQLQELGLESQEQAKKVFILHLPELTKCCLSFGLNVIFQDVPNLTQLYANNATTIVFNDGVPCFESLVMGNVRCVDPFHFLNWSKIKNIEFGYTKECIKLCNELQDVENLKIENVNEGSPNINWSKLKHLSYLYWDFETVPCLQSLESLYIQWSLPTFDILKDFPVCKKLKKFTMESKYPIDIDCKQLAIVFP